MSLLKYFERNLYPCPLIYPSDYPVLDDKTFVSMEQTFGGCQNQTMFFAFPRNLEGGDRYFDVYLWDIMLEKKYTRFIVQKDTYMTIQEEQMLDEYLLKDCVVDADSIERILKVCQSEYPEIHMIRYERECSLIGHLYYAMHQGGPRELLYKANLDYFAAHVEQIDSYNMIGTCPQAIFDGISMELLKLLNKNRVGIGILSDENSKKRANEIYEKFGGVISRETFNGYQWAYLDIALDNQEIVYKKKYYQVFGKITSDVIYLIYLEYIKAAEAIKHFYKMPPVTDPSQIITLERRATSIWNYVKQEEEWNNRLLTQAKKNEKYCYSDDNYMIVIPQNLYDILKEADSQRNCLWDYIEPVAMGMTVVMFMRSSENPNKSLITIEIGEDRYIEQAYRAYNRDIEEHEQEWLRKYAMLKGLELRMGSDRLEDYFEDYENDDYNDDGREDICDENDSQNYLDIDADLDLILT